MQDVAIDAVSGEEIGFLSPGRYRMKVDCFGDVRQSRHGHAYFFTVRLFHNGSKVALHDTVCGTPRTLVMLRAGMSFYLGKYVTVKVAHTKYGEQLCMGASACWNTLSDDPEG